MPKCEYQEILKNLRIETNRRVCLLLGEEEYTPKPVIYAVKKTNNSTVYSKPSKRK